MEEDTLVEAMKFAHKDCYFKQIFAESLLSVNQKGIVL
jgi:hypothetical protein